MSIDLNHTIVHARDRQASAEFLGRILGLEVGAPWGPFIPLTTGNGVTLDYATAEEETIAPQHYAFLVPEDQFDVILARIERAGVTYYADHRFERPGEINHNDGGRGVYFLDPDGHAMEVITRPYGAAPY
ncbi:VOC family protein [Rhizohabitans arisaemae]|uniref:VOC family protein n=1 Tax=Rhizohabitans arisaemae TaxID=2720610 RepID=UPI0024B1C2CD|nr:VOC family protein [Rhizohabitans arisaemae]